MCIEMKNEWFDVRTGVRQGGILSPLLFIVHWDQCMKEICIHEKRENTFEFADDVAVVTENDRNLQNAIKWRVDLERGMKGRLKNGSNEKNRGDCEV